MYSNTCYQLKTGCYKHMLLYTRLMVTTKQKPMNNWCPMWLVWGTHGWSIFIVKQSIFFLSIMYGAYCAQMFSCVWLFATAWTIACQVPLSMGFSRQEYWSGLPFPSPGDLPNPGIELTFLMFPASAVGFFTISTTWEAPYTYQFS